MPRSISSNVRMPRSSRHFSTTCARSSRRRAASSAKRCSSACRACSLTSHLAAQRFSPRSNGHSVACISPETISAPPTPRPQSRRVARPRWRSNPHSPQKRLWRHRHDLPGPKAAADEAKRHCQVADAGAGLNRGESDLSPSRRRLVSLATGEYRAPRFLQFMYLSIYGLLPGWVLYEILPAPLSLLAATAVVAGAAWRAVEISVSQTVD